MGEEQSDVEVIAVCREVARQARFEDCAGCEDWNPLDSEQSRVAKSSLAVINEFYASDPTRASVCKDFRMFLSLPCWDYVLAKEMGYLLPIAVCRQEEYCRDNPCQSIPGKTLRELAEAYANYEQAVGKSRTTCAQNRISLADFLSVTRDNAMHGSLLCIASYWTYLNLGTCVIEDAASQAFAKCAWAEVESWQAPNRQNYAVKVARDTAMKHLTTKGLI